jgi:acetolactate synthase-1/2/3 large subunit
MLILGTRLGLRQTTYNFDDFGRNAFKIMVDIDEAELNKPTLNVDIKIHSDLKLFLENLLGKLKGVNIPPFKEWINWGNTLKKRLPSFSDDNPSKKGYVNSYVFVKELFNLLPPESTVVTGNGTAYTCTYQAMHIKKGMRVFANQGCAAMGYDLPAAIGACIGKNKKDIILITGDGSIMMNLQELQTIFAYQLPIKIFLLENNGYVAIRTTQASFFEKRFVGESPNSRLFMPDFEKVTNAFGIKYFRIVDEISLSDKLSGVLNTEGPAFCEIKMDPNQTLFPKVASFKTPEGKMVSKPMEEMFPFLSSVVNTNFKK